MRDDLAGLTPETLLAHAEFVQRLARRLVRDLDAADDLAQDTWLSALTRGTGKFRQLRAWLTTVARNVAHTTVLRQRRRLEREQASARQEELPATSEIVAKVEVHERVVRAVLALREPYRTTVVLRFFQDLSPLEIAAREAVSVETVRTRIKRALAMLRARLEHEIGYQGLWSLALPHLTTSITSTAASAPLAILSGVLGMSAGVKILLFTAISVGLTVGAWQLTQDRQSPAAVDTPRVAEPVQQPVPLAREQVTSDQAAVPITTPDPDRSSDAVASAPESTPAKSSDEQGNDRLVRVLERGANEGLLDVEELIRALQDLARDVELKPDGTVVFARARLKGRCEANEISVNVTIEVPIEGDERYKSSSVTVSVLPPTEINKTPGAYLNFDYRGNFAAMDKSQDAPAGLMVTFSEKRTVINQMFYRYGRANPDSPEQWYSVHKPLPHQGRRDFAEFEGWASLWERAYRKH